MFNVGIVVVVLFIWRSVYSLRAHLMDRVMTLKRTTTNIMMIASELISSIVLLGQRE